MHGAIPGVAAALIHVRRSPIRRREPLVVESGFPHPARPDLKQADFRRTGRAVRVRGVAARWLGGERGAHNSIRPISPIFLQTVQRGQSACTKGLVEILTTEQLGPESPQHIPSGDKTG